VSVKDGRSCAVDALWDNEAAAVFSDFASARGFEEVVAFELSTFDASVPFLSCFETSGAAVSLTAAGDDFGRDFFEVFADCDASLLGVSFGPSLLDGTLKEALLGLPAEGVSDIAISPMCGWSTDDVELLFFCARDQKIHAADFVLSPGNCGGAVSIEDA
jgi:hypothetical protein